MFGNLRWLNGNLRTTSGIVRQTSESARQTPEIVREALENVRKTCGKKCSKSFGNYLGNLVKCSVNLRTFSVSFGKIRNTGKYLANFWKCSENFVICSENFSKRSANFRNWQIQFSLGLLLKGNYTQHSLITQTVHSWKIGFHCC